jgi:hypothetical protein
LFSIVVLEGEDPPWLLSEEVHPTTKRSRLSATCIRGKNFIARIIVVNGKLDKIDTDRVGKVKSYP